MDWPTVSVSVAISAPVQSVWELASDITLLPRFSDELQSVEWMDAGPRLGARFKGANTPSPPHYQARPMIRLRIADSAKTALGSGHRVDSSRTEGDISARRDSPRAA